MYKLLVDKHVEVGPQCVLSSSWTFKLSMRSLPWSSHLLKHFWIDKLVQESLDFTISSAKTDKKKLVGTSVVENTFIWVHCSLLHLHKIVEGLYFHCSLSVCRSVCLSVCLCVRLCLWTKFQPNKWTYLDAVFAKWLLTAMTRTLLKFVTLDQRSRSQWRNTHFFLVVYSVLV